MFGRFTECSLALPPDVRKRSALPFFRLKRVGCATLSGHSPDLSRIPEGQRPPHISRQSRGSFAQPQTTLAIPV